MLKVFILVMTYSVGNSVHIEHVPNFQTYDQCRTAGSVWDSNLRRAYTTGDRFDRNVIISFSCIQGVK